MAIKFTNAAYEYEHNKAPRGVGMWAFMIRARDEIVAQKNYPYDHYQQGAYVILWTSKVMTLTEAKKEIKEWLSKNGFSGIVAVAD